MIGVVLGLTGAGMSRIAAPVWSDLRAREPALRLDSKVAAAGQGLTLALLGGFRGLVADATWIRLYTLWERRDLPGTDTLIHLVPSIDPRPVYFWLNGARIMGYDFPVWRIEGAGGFDVVPAALQTRISQEQARLAIAHLNAAMTFHPASAELWVERGNIELNRLHDLESAAESYRRAWEQPNAPYYAARLHAEMLRRLGRKREALDWLIKLYPQLPLDDEAAGAALVLSRIGDLERELGVPTAEKYRPGNSPHPASGGLR
jgi:tetratricopeptide (TPR) repeat protein